MRHVHFVQSIETLQGGGLGGAALGLHRAQLASGLGSELCCTRDPASAPCGLPHVTDLPRSGPGKLFYSRSLPATAKSLVADSDVVHGHGLYVATNYFFGREARRQRRPLVYHAHGFFDPWILARSKMRKRIVMALFESRNLTYCSLWRALTLKEADQIRAQGITAKIVVLPNGIDLAEIDADATSDPAAHPALARNRPKRILLLSRIHPKKGFDLLIPAWAQLAAQFPDWEIAICGPDENGYKTEVERMIREAEVADSCKVFSGVSGAEKRAVFRSADLFCLPSHSEGFPVAVVEAAAHRVPVVMTTECNFPELGGAGGAWICEPDVESLKTTLEEALSRDDAERKQRGEVGRALIESGYTWTQIAARLEEACASQATDL